MNVKVWSETLRGRKFLGKIDIDGRIILIISPKEMGWKYMD